MKDKIVKQINSCFFFSSATINESYDTTRIQRNYDIKYSEVPIRPPKALVKNGHNIEQSSLMKPIYIEKCIFCAETSDLNSEGCLNFKWSL